MSKGTLSTDPPLFNLRAAVKAELGMRSTGSKAKPAGANARMSPGRTAASAKAELARRLRAVRLRPTKQRISLAQLLFNVQDRHVTAEQLHEEALRHGAGMALATVYNTLHQFTQAGLLRQVIVDGDKIHFDTNVGDHHHFYFADADMLVDIPGGDVLIDGLPRPPVGTEIDRVDVIVRLKSRHRV